MKRHNSIVAEIAAKVSQFHDKKIPFRISHGSTNSTRHNVYNRQDTVDTGELNRVLDINTAKRTALIEPNVPMDRLVATTLQYGLVPPVVMEFPGITSGGGYSGTAGESSSFKHGFFDKTVNYVEMVLGNGEVVKASNQEHQDLFQGAAGAAGTLGITTLLELQLNEAKPYVEATYHPVNSTDEALQKVRDLTVQEDLDFVDGIMYSNDRGAVVSGRLVTEKPAEAKVQYFSRPWDPWFYLHVKDTIGSHETSPVIEVIPLAEYLFRYDRGGFWVGASAFKYWRFPFNRFTRWFLDDFLHTRMLYRALHASRQSQRYVVQDLALPYDTAAEFVRYTDKKFGIYPLWLCPLKQGALPTFHPHLAEMEADGVTLKPMINVGLWGFGPRNRDMFIAANRDLEHELRRLNGMKWFYAQTYYTEDEFWSIYDKEWYDNLRTKYSATRLPTVYDKVRVDIDEEKEELKKSWVPAVLKIWPFAGIWGLWKAMRSGEWKIPRKTKLAKLEVGSASVFESTE